MKKISFILIFLSSLILSSCATIFTGTKDRISFNTTPPGAMIYIDGLEQCRTPCSILVKRRLEDTEVEFKLDGYDTRIIKLSKDLNIMSVFNLGNLIAWGIDALSGAVMKYDRKSYDIILEGKKTSMILPNRIDIDTKKKTVDLYIIGN
ncbi:MAG: PEGA domain-containing protein [Bacteroidota bacterium]